ncbi:serine/threonine protein kinase [Streptomyces viridochromogenes]|uniref:non-specific serine/threonine protein kinase n=1 Tax=Streptomyces viridochromogenes TaxID=1938 RepID=A0A0J7ZF55_STRVR|nr:serine/threonine-protein kinase [Streptomyces viridochromogenes]KMS74756.1 serine/threonine protein kinase [Streptomyces viridochromogenes]
MLIAGRYRLSEPIGRGGMGEVWRAYDESLARDVAVKLLLPQDSDPTATSRFRLEAQTAARIDHPNVVGVRDFGEYDNRLFLVMELVRGDSLATTLVRSGALPAERVARIAAQAAAGLAAAHRQGIVHRDIKPGNLLLDADGTLKIGDFGIARFLDDPGAALTATGQIVGTSLYLAPERALGQPAGPASDVYALGCVLYQLLTGRPPFQADTAVAILHQHLDAVPVPPRELGVPGLPPAFESYLLGLLAKEPEHRPAAQRAADWFADGAWQGRPEPLPDATAPAASAPGSQRVGETSNPTTYMLPSAQGTASAAGSRTGSRTRTRPGAGPGTRPGARPRSGSRSKPSSQSRTRVAVTAAAAALFMAAMLIGMLWFSPDNTGAEGTKSEAPPSPSASTPTPSTASASPLESSPSPRPDAVETSVGQEGQDDEKQEKERREREKREQERARLEQEQQRAVQQDDDGDDSGEGDD